VPDAVPRRAMSPRKTRIREMADRLAPERDRWIGRNAFYYEQDEAYLRFLVPEGLYGETQISRFRHGWLLRMVVFAFRKLKAF
jgi:hypothetical protein